MAHLLRGFHLERLGGGSLVHFWHGIEKWDAIRCVSRAASLGPATELAAKVAGVVSPRNDRPRVTVRILDYTGARVADVEAEGGDDD